MKNKGFTLLELLGVIIILAILVTLSFPSIINFIKSSTEKKDKIINDLIVSAAEAYINDNSSNLYITSGTEYCISLDALIGKNYLSESSISSDFASKNVKFTYLDKINYEIVDNCSICQLISGVDISLGIKYQCKVKNDMEAEFEDGYYFYLLSNNDDNTMTLIMERNIFYDEKNDVGKVATATNKGLVAWYADADDSSNGPVTAMDYLYNATKDWNNIPNVIVDYQDSNKKYGGVKTEGDVTKITKLDGTVTATYKNLKARLAKLSEIKNYNSTTKAYAYLYDYLYLHNDIQKNPLNGIFGYWTFYASTDSTSWPIRYSSGSLAENTSSKYGVRPVITVKNPIILD